MYHICFVTGRIAGKILKFFPAVSQSLQFQFFNLNTKYLWYIEILKFYLLVLQRKELRNPVVDYLVGRNGKTIGVVKG
jgi:hypothetical protein